MLNVPNIYSAFGDFWILVKEVLGGWLLYGGFWVCSLLGGIGGLGKSGGEVLFVVKIRPPPVVFGRGPIGIKYLWMLLTVCLEIL